MHRCYSARLIMMKTGNSTCQYVVAGYCYWISMHGRVRASEGLCKIFWFLNKSCHKYHKPDNYWMEYSFTIFYFPGTGQRKFNRMKLTICLSDIMSILSETWLLFSRFKLWTLNCNNQDWLHYSTYTRQLSKIKTTVECQRNGCGISNCLLASLSVFYSHIILFLLPTSGKKKKKHTFVNT